LLPIPALKFGLRPDRAASVCPLTAPPLVVFSTPKLKLPPPPDTLQSMPKDCRSLRDTSAKRTRMLTCVEPSTVVRLIGAWPGGE
jgi:hypothetical protein